MGGRRGPSVSIEHSPRAAGARAPTTMPRAFASVSKDMQDIMRVLSAPLRLELLMLLAQHKCSVSGLRDAMNMDMPLISKYLRILRDSGLVVCRSHKTHHVYELTDSVRVSRGPQTIRLTFSRTKGARLILDIPIDAAGPVSSPPTGDSSARSDEKSGDTKLESPRGPDARGTAEPVSTSNAADAAGSIVVKAKAPSREQRAGAD